MSRSKPKSAMAALIESGISSMMIDAEVGLSERESVLEPKPNAHFPAENVADLHIITLNPDDCSLWEYYDRPESELGDIEALANSMRENGQQEPILVRPTQSTNKTKYEVIFGNRRWRAAKLANISLTAIVKNLTDQKAALCQKEENENRKDLSDYARALSYRKLIERGIFASESELCQKMSVSKKTINDVMAFLRVPDVLKNKIPNFSTISRVTATKLALLSKDEKTLEILIEHAQKIGEKILNSNNIEKFIATYSRDPQIKESPSSMIIQDRKGRGVVAIKSYISGAVLINLDKRLANKLSIDTIKEHMEALLQKVMD